MLQGALIYLLFLPVAAALPLLFERSDRAVRWLTLLVTVITLCTALLLFHFSSRFQPSVGRWLLYVDHPWIDRYGVRFSLGLDGISLLLVTLTASMALNYSTFHTKPEIMARIIMRALPKSSDGLENYATFTLIEMDEDDLPERLYTKDELQAILFMVAGNIRRRLKR